MNRLRHILRRNCFLILPFLLNSRCCSQGAIANVIYLMRQMGCMGYNVSVHMAAVETMALNSHTFHLLG